MDENLPMIRISVRNLVEFILREGNIDNRTGGGQDPENMQMGSRIHRKIQRQMGSDYQAEVPLKTEIVCDGFTLKIEGRADGLIHTKEQVMVDEIKGVLRELDRVQEPAGIHLAQAKCYASMVAEQEGVDEIGVQMTYCQMETEEVKRFQYSYRSNELKVWFDEVIRQYEKWAKFQIEWRKARNASVKGIEFPFPYRKGQRDLAVSVYRTILRKKKLFIQAPTGVGKTISTVFPAVKAVGEELGEKIFYLTAKTITRTVAEQAFETLREQNLKFKVITLTAKEKICFCEETSCNPDDCPYAKGHFDRVNDAVYIDSSFDTKKRLLMNGVDVSTRYAMRSREMYQRYATYIFRVVKAKMGNYLIFFPSYRFMEDVYQEFTQLLASDEEEMELVIQQKHMDEEERENFLRAFEMGREKSLIGFGVLGGIFSEGIDLTNEKLIGTLIIGTGLPQVCNEREILKSYFDQKGLYGFDYAYRYPGMNKVLQAAGRVIRTEDDRGVILLLDERFQREKGKEIFPKEWADCERCRLDIVEEKIRLFWEKQTDN